MSRIEIKGSGLNIINAGIGRYFCSCGHSGPWVDYYHKDKFRCPKCKAKGWIYVKVKNKTSLNYYSNKKDPEITLVEPEIAEVLLYSYNIIFENKEAYIEEVAQAYYYDYNEGKLLNSKKKEVDIGSVKNADATKAYNKIIELYNSTHPYKVEIYVGYDLSSFKAFGDCMKNKNLTVLNDFGLMSSTYSRNLKNSINRNGSNVENILGLPKSIINYIRLGDNEYDKELRHEAVLSIKKECDGITADNIMHIVKLAHRLIDIEFELRNTNNRNAYGYTLKYDYRLPEICGCLSMLFNNKYSIEVMDRYFSNINDYQGLNVIDATKTMRDYVQMNLDMKQQYEKYPRSLAMAHDVTMKNYNYIANEVEQKKIATEYEKNKWLEYEADGLCILLPKSADDIIAEGKALHHCGASYVGKVASGRCIMAFVRESSAKDVSLGTIEVENGRILQKRTFGNKALKTMHSNFVKKWAKVKGLDLY